MKNKKIGIMTFPNSPSFGASLQMYGLQRALKDLGTTPEIINYINPYMRDKKHIRKQKANVLKKMALAVNDMPAKRKFRRFETQMTLHPAKPIHEAKALTQVAQRYDYMVCGSDQVWNPLITGNDGSYFFDFCEDNSKKVAYAPSFGVNTLPEEQVQVIAAELQKFAALSVRETRGQQLVEELTGRTCPVVIDPSMLLTREAWRSLAKKPSNLPERYIVYFIFNHNEKVSTFARKMSEQTGLPIVILGGGPLNRLRDRRNIGPIGPDEWLYAIANADHVITDSFHGAAFSIIFERSLFVSMASATNSRLVTLMETFHMENRVLDYEAFSVESATDYEEVRQIMEQKRQESLSYLKESLMLEK